MHSEPRNQEQELENALSSAAEPVGSGDDVDWEMVLENLIGGAAEAVFESTDEEIEAELRSFGEEPDEVAAEVRGVLLEAVDRFEREGRRVRKRPAPRSSVRGPRLPS